MTWWSVSLTFGFCIFLFLRAVDQIIAAISFLKQPPPIPVLNAVSQERLAVSQIAATLIAGYGQNPLSIPDDGRYLIVQTAWKIYQDVSSTQPYGVPELIGR